MGSFINEAFEGLFVFLRFFRRVLGPSDNLAISTGRE